MRSIPLRRSQLVGTNGPGSLVISPEGEMAIVGALDYWFTGDSSKEENRIEFEIFEPRLRTFLGVHKLYTPPDYRQSTLDVPNKNQTIPLLRFPLWHYCPFCKSMEKFGSNVESSRKFCHTCSENRYFKQLPFITICKKGHISDFPWMEWVHYGENCSKKLKIATNSGASLDSWSISCECSATRSLKGVTAHREQSSVVTENLYGDSRKYICKGHKAWCGEEYETCDEPVMAILRNSLNVYLPETISVISLPGERNDHIDELINLIQRNVILQNLLNSTQDIAKKTKILSDSQNNKLPLKEYEKVILYITDTTEPVEDEIISPITLRRKEFEVLLENQNEPFLKVFEEWSSDDEDAEKYSGKYLKFIKKINRITKLRETRALAGFKRLTSAQDDGSYKFEPNYDNLYYKKVKNHEKWLPANTVFGEGIFIQFNLEEIEKWESDEKVTKYFEKYLYRIRHMKHFIPEIIEKPRNIMMHTLTHFIIDEISKTSGYNMASIRERLYIGENEAGILIYTSAGDIEGTFGGLVRMGTKQRFFKLLDSALSYSNWCSSDPVCSELGLSSGQGLNGSNGAACYNCSYLPETSCEFGNKYLDRTLLIDDLLGYFKS